MAEKRLYAAIDHAVIDSPAFSKLTGEAVRLLVIMSRQHNGSNNGRLQATHSYSKYRGIASNNTLAKAISSLIARGFVYRTRSHGIDCATGKNVPALYALTWLPLTKNKKGLFLSGFLPNAYESITIQQKSGGQKLHQECIKNRTLSLKKHQVEPVSENALSATGKAATESAKTAPYEHVPVYVASCSTG